MKDAFAKSLRGQDGLHHVRRVQAGARRRARRSTTAATSSPFDVWERIEPGQGTYDRWTYDGTGNVVTDPPSAADPRALIDPFIHCVTERTTRSNPAFSPRRPHAM